MRRVHVLLLGAAFFGGISGWAIWLAATSDGRWAMLLPFVLLAAGVFFVAASMEARP